MILVWLRGFWIGLALLGCLSAIGCSDEPLASTDVKSYDQPISEDELRAYFAVLESLPDKKVPTLPPLYPPLPNWNTARSLPVGELTNVERKSIDDHMKVEWFQKHLQQSKAFQRALRKERLTAQQFVGLTVAFGLALSRNDLPANEDIDKILARGMQNVGSLEKDKRVFNLLTQDAAYYVLEQAAWIPLVDRLKRMKKVPPENCELVKAHREKFDRCFPEDLRGNPLQGLSKLLEDESLPFTDPGGINPDDHIVWNREAALVGTDGQPVPLKQAKEPAALLPVPRSEYLE